MPPTAHKVLFASDRRGSRDAWLIRIGDGEVPHAPELVKTGVGNIRPLGLTRNGSFYYGILAGWDDVFLGTLDPTTGEVREPAKKISRRFEGNNTEPDWSPDGQYLAYVSRRDSNSSIFGAGGAPASSWSLVIHSLETGQDRELPLSLTNQYQLRPRWSPDGRSLLTPGRDRKGRQGVYRIDAQSGDITRLVLSDTTWQRGLGDGTAVFYQDWDADRRTTRIMKRELETGRDTELLFLDGEEARPFPMRDMATSPDGRHLAFCFPGGLLKVMPRSGGNARTLYHGRRDHPSGACRIAWMPDGRQLLLSHRVARSENPQGFVMRLRDRKEMDLPLGEAVERLRRDRKYSELFQAVFGRIPTHVDLANALASYGRTILSGDAPIDRYLHGEHEALSQQERQGLGIFRGKGNCTVCHLGPTFTDERFHNTGVAWQDGALLDQGRYMVTGKEDDRGAFKTPTLREVARNAPYMHDGSLATLEDVIEFYDRGGNPNPYRDSELRRLNLTPTEQQAVVTFLHALSGRVQDGIPTR